MSSPIDRNTPPHLQPIRSATHPLSWLLLAFTFLTVAYGWRLRDQDLFAPDDGIGYDLGIVGGCLILLLLLYSVRKRVVALRGLGGIRYWLNIHMTMGLLGPVAILYHCNFHLGATNSNVALGSMLLVMASGIVGRFIYLKINDTLRGELISLSAMQCDISSIKDKLEHMPLINEQLKSGMERFIADELAPLKGLKKKAWRLLTLGYRIRTMRRSAMGQIVGSLNMEAEQRGWDSKTLKLREREYRWLVDHYLFLTRRIAELSAYSRMFALWHVIHIPLFIMLVLTGFAHVIAVHFLY